VSQHTNPGSWILHTASRCACLAARYSTYTLSCSFQKGELPSVLFLREGVKRQYGRAPAPAFHEAALVRHGGRGSGVGALHSLLYYTVLYCTVMYWSDLFRWPGPGPLRSTRLH